MDREGLSGRPDPERVRVYRVIARLNVGGPAQHVIALAHGLDPHRYESQLFVGALGPGELGLEPSGADRAGVEDAGDIGKATVHEVPGLSPVGGILADARALWWLYWRFRRDRPEIVHTHTAKAGAVGRVAAALAGVPIRLHTYHGHVLGGDYFSPFRTALYRFIEQQLARISRRLIAVSRSQARQLSEHHRVAAADKFQVISLGLDLEPFTGVDRAVARTEARQRLGLADSDQVVAIVGRIVPIKNHELLLRSLASLARSGRPVHLLVIGGGESRLLDELRRLATELGLQERVQWLGWRRDLPSLYAASDALAVTSHDEGTPVAVIEALAIGTPVVARSVGGIPDMLEGVDCARLVDGAGPREFASALQSVLDAPPVDDDIRDGLRESTARRYSATRLAREVAALYEAELDALGPTI